ncbi:MAG: type II secretion system protein [Gammaproteobacteria bacterium]|nr:type II secretion system protein [Gammaproteobacteria bacterium]
MKNNQHKLNGFTLLEMLLVLVIMSAVLMMIVNYGTQRMAQFKRDKTALQMQQIINAAMNYYINNGKWPVDWEYNDEFLFQTPLMGTYLPNALFPNMGADLYPTATANFTGTNRFIVHYDTTGYTVQAPVPTVIEAQLIAGMLPGGFVRTDSNGTFAAATVSIPGQNLNNARSINYAGVYSSGGCVPAPVCPGNMKPSIIVAPVGVSGVYDTPSCSSASDPTSCSNVNITPLSSFTAFARGGQGANGAPVPDNTNLLDCAIYNPTPQGCNNPWGNGTAYTALSATDDSATKYWRVCLAVITEKGRIVPSAANQGRLMGSVMAITRCVPNNEAPVGSAINVWGVNSNNVP